MPHRWAEATDARCGRRAIAAGNPAAFCVHRISDGAPAGDLFCRVDPGRTWVAMASSQTGDASVMMRPADASLAIVGLGHRTGYVPGQRTVARQRRHDDAIGQGQRTEADWGEQIVVARERVLSALLL